MTKTVNEIIKNEFKKIYKYNIVQFDNNVIEDLLHKILYSYKNELSKKDEQLEIMNEQCDCAIRKILKQQLYKEDFENKFIEYCRFDDLVKEKYVLKDNSKYDKLPSKDIK